MFGIFAVVILTAARGVFLVFNQTDLFFDEAQYWGWGLNLDFGYFSKPPLLAWSIRGTTELCGTGEACVRFVSPVFYGLTGVTAGLLASRVAYRMGGSAGAAFIWTALLFATIPGVSFATRLVSTDAPLLFAFALALLFLDRFRENTTALNAAMIGLAIGIGLNAKYAMIYFLICWLFWALLSRDGRQTLFHPLVLLTIIIAAACITPNIWWNHSNEWITFAHTKDNANWQGLQLHFDNMAEFTGAQIGILGPILFLALLIGLFNPKKRQNSDVLFLLCFALPVTLIIVVQATLSRAHANWAAVTFIAYTVLAVSWLVTWRAKPLLMITAALHITIFIGLGVADIYAKQLVHHKFGASYKRIIGWEDFAGKVSEIAQKTGAKTIVTGRRKFTAELLYYLRNEDLELRTFAPTGRPHDHYEMTIPLAKSDRTPVLVISSCPPGNQSDNIEVFDELRVPINTRHAIVAYPYLSQSNAILREDIC